MSPDLREVVVTEGGKEKIGMRGMVETELKLPTLRSPFVPAYHFQNVLSIYCFPQSCLFQYHMIIMRPSFAYR